MVRDLLELLVREPEAISIHPWPPDEVAKHESAARSNSFMGPGPSKNLVKPAPASVPEGLRILTTAMLAASKRKASPSAIASG